MPVSDLGYRGAVFFAGGGAGAGLTGRGGTGKLAGLRFIGNFRRWEMLTVPRYDYRCVECDNHFELRQSFSEAGTGFCPECSGAGQRVYHAVPVIYKGSGFYTTDYGRPKPPAENGAGKNGSDGAKPAGDGGKAADAAPAASDGASGSGSGGGESVGRRRRGLGLDWLLLGVHHPHPNPPP